MPCVNADGTLTPSALKVLHALESVHTAAEVAAQADLPLFKVRGSFRELVEAGFVEETDGSYRLTTAGKSKIT